MEMLARPLRGLKKGEDSLAREIIGQPLKAITELLMTFKGSTRRFNLSFNFLAYY